MFDTDKRWKAVGDVFVNKCLKLQPGEKLMIAQEEIETWPLALATYESAIKAGGYPQIQLKSAYLRHAFVKYGSEEQYTWPPGIEALGMDFEVVHAGTDAALFAELESAYQRKAAWVGWVYTPHWAPIKFEGEFIRITKNFLP